MEKHKQQQQQQQHKKKAAPEQKGEASKSGNPPAQRSETINARKSALQEFSGQVQLPVAGTGAGFVRTGSVSFNPGDPGINKRTALLSAAWSEWRCRRLTMKYVPDGSAFAADNQTGEVIINFNENWYTTVSIDADSARSKYPSAVGNAWKAVQLHCDPKILKQWRYLRSSEGSQGVDANLYDIMCEVLTFNTPSTNFVGWIEFAGLVEFRGNYVPQTTSVVRTNKIFSFAETTNQTLNSGVLAQLVAPSASIFGGGTSGIMPHSMLTGCTIDLLGMTTLKGGTYTYTCMAQFIGTTVTSHSLSPIFTLPPGGFERGSDWTMAGGSFTTCTAVCTGVVCVPEEASGQMVFQVGVTGTGTLQCQDWSLEIIALV